jgi:hypothetical protein
MDFIVWEFAAAAAAIFQYTFAKDNLLGPLRQLIAETREVYNWSVVFAERKKN